MREEIQSLLKTVTNNVFQSYVNVQQTYPCLVWSLSNTGSGSHDGVEFFDQYLRVELYAKTSKDRNELEISLIKTLFNHGWVNKSNRELSDPEYYRHDLSFERKE